MADNDSDFAQPLAALSVQNPVTVTTSVTPSLSSLMSGSLNLFWDGTSPATPISTVTVTGTPAAVVFTFGGSIGALTPYPIAVAFSLTAGGFSCRARTPDGSTPGAGIGALFYWIAV